jgi:hypothetical protein
MIELQVVCGLTMKMRILIMLAGWTALVSEALGQSILFDFENATLHAPLPISITVSGLTAQFSATGQGFSIQQADTMGFTPAGFSGYCLYPSSVYLSDLLVTFSQALNDFSILYAPQELACDSSARMRVTAYLDSSVIGTSTTTADPPGTWPNLATRPRRGSFAIQRNGLGAVRGGRMASGDCCCRQGRNDPTFRLAGAE